MNPLIHRKNVTAVFLLAFMLVCFATSTTVQAQLSPPPDGAYPSGNTAEGQDALYSLRLGVYNTALGFHALYSNTSGSFNTATGISALTQNVDGKENTANGVGALYHNTHGDWNTATGSGALSSQIDGFYNTADGANALLFNKHGSHNTAVGHKALFDNRSGGNNTAVGNNALLFNRDSYNTAVGARSLESNTTGSPNTAVGFEALRDNTNGQANTAVGFHALFANIGTNPNFPNPNDGGFNTAVGHQALFHNTHGSGNTADGLQALYHNTSGGSNTAIGVSALFRNQDGTANIALGTYAGSNLTSGDNNIDIGNPGVAGESNAIRIGTDGTHNATFIAGISGSPIAGAAVVVNGNGRLGVATSSARFKDEIKPMDQASEAILALKPVSFHYKKEIDPEALPQFGLVAEDVEKVNPDLVIHDADGKVYTVRYEAVNAMLLNEFLKEHRKVEELEANAARQQKQIEALTAGLQKVSATLAAVSPSDGGLELNKFATGRIRRGGPAPQTAQNTD
jgi:hypothetical protein